MVIMDKVYIVTKGSYSDYRIVKVYKEKTKAEFLANTIHGQIEEFSLCEEIGQKYYQISANKKYLLEYENELAFKQNFYINFGVNNTLDFPIDEGSSYTNKIYCDFCKSPKSITILIFRILIRDNINEIELRKIYEKVLDDTFSEIKSLMNLEGWTSNMISELLKQPKHMARIAEREREAKCQ